MTAWLVYLWTVLTHLPALAGVLLADWRAYRRGEYRIAARIDVNGRVLEQRGRIYARKDDAGALAATTAPILNLKVRHTRAADGVVTEYEFEGPNGGPLTIKEKRDG